MEINSLHSKSYKLAVKYVIKYANTDIPFVLFSKNERKQKISLDDLIHLF